MLIFITDICVRNKWLRKRKRESLARTLQAHCLVAQTKHASVFMMNLNAEGVGESASCVCSVHTECVIFQVASY